MFQTDLPMAEGNEEESVEVAWDVEIDARVKEIEEGQVELVSAEDAEQRIRAKFAELRSHRTPVA